MRSGEDKSANLSAAGRLVAQAATAGAKLVVLPEMFACCGRWPVMLEQAEPVPGPTSRALAELARRHAIVLVAGSFCEQASVPGRAYNACLVLGPDGALLAHYRKIHLFDVALEGQPAFRESDWLLPGEAVVVADTPLGKLGIAICYDLRFGGLFERLGGAGAEVLCVPAAFTATTGRDHWELLVRARAVEQQAYVVAANQVGRHSETWTTYGHSLIVDPWGRVLADAGDEEGIVVAEIDAERIFETRARVPALAHRRPLGGPSTDEVR